MNATVAGGGDDVRPHGCPLHAAADSSACSADSAARAANSSARAADLPADFAANTTARELKQRVLAQVRRIVLPVDLYVGLLLAVDHDGRLGAAA